MGKERGGRKTMRNEPRQSSLEGCRMANSWLLKPLGEKEKTKPYLISGFAMISAPKVTKKPYID